MAEVIREGHGFGGFFATAEEACRVARTLASEKNIETEAYWSEEDLTWRVSEINYFEVDDKRRYYAELNRHLGKWGWLESTYADQSILAARQFHKEHRVIPPSGEKHFTFNKQPIKKEHKEHKEWYVRDPDVEDWQQILEAIYGVRGDDERKINLYEHKYFDVSNRLEELEKMDNFDRLRLQLSGENYDEQVRILVAWKLKLRKQVDELKAKLPKLPEPEPWYERHPGTATSQLKPTSKLKINYVGISTEIQIKFLRDRLHLVQEKLQKLNSMTRSERAKLHPSYDEQVDILQAWSQRLTEELHRWTNPAPRKTSRFSWLNRRS